MADLNNLDAVFVMVGSVIVSGFGQGDAITLQDVQPDLELVEGDSGLAIFVANNSKAKILTISLMQNSPSYKELHQLLQVQRATIKTGVLPRLPVEVFDPGNGDTVSGEAAFISGTAFDKQKSPVNKVFTLGLINVVEKGGDSILLF